MLKQRIFTESPVDGAGRSDITFAATVILLWGLGMVTLYITSAGYAARIFDNPFYFVKRQLVYSLIGFLLLLLFVAVPLDVVRAVLPALVVGSIVLCLLVFLPGIGVERNGARRWIRLPLLATFQPSEAAKLAVILFLSNLFAKPRKPADDLAGVALGDEHFDKSLSLAAPMIGLVVFVFIVLLQKDFSTGLFILSLGIILFFAAGMRIGWFLAFCVLAIPAALLFIFLEPYRVNRLIAFVRPDFDLHGLNYQTNAARLAVSAGGFWGEGIGSGLTRVNRIPEVQADYIFAGWAEAMGFAGVLTFFLLQIAFAWRGFRAALHCSDRFGAFAAFGCTASIVLQTIINCGVVSSAFPATGIPLPFFSSGGSSLIMTFCMCGVILQVSRKQGKAEIFPEATIGEDIIGTNIIDTNIIGVEQ